MIMFPASTLPQINLPKSRVYRQTLGGERERERERDGRSELEKLALATSIQSFPNRQVGCPDTCVHGAALG